MGKNDKDVTSVDMFETWIPTPTTPGRVPSIAITCSYGLPVDCGASFAASRLLELGNLRPSTRYSSVTVMRDDDGGLIVRGVLGRE